jgi:hypothetical protein
MKPLTDRTPLYAIWILLAGALVLSVVERQWYTSLMAVAALVLTLLPSVFQRRYNIYIPPVLITGTAFFMYATVFLGEAEGFYNRFWWWDLVMHLGSAVGFGLIGVIILLLEFGQNRAESHPFVFAFFSFCFAVTVGTIWEVYEFGMDQFLGFNMQKSGLFDTMSDLIIDCIGASVAALAGYLYVIEFEKNPFKGLIERGYLGNKFLSKRKNQ